MLAIIGAFWEKIWFSGGKVAVENRARCYKHLLRGNYFILGPKIRLHARYIGAFFGEKLTFGGGRGSRKRARYYKRVLRENLTFGTLIPRSKHWLSAKTSIFCLKSQNRARYYRRVWGAILHFGLKNSKTCSILYASFERKIDFRGSKSKTCSVLEARFERKISFGGGGGAYLAFVAHFRFKIILLYQNLWHFLGSNHTWLSTQKIEKIA